MSEHLKIMSTYPPKEFIGATNKVLSLVDRFLKLPTTIAMFSSENVESRGALCLYYRIVGTAILTLNLRFCGKEDADSNACRARDSAETLHNHFPLDTSSWQHCYPVSDAYGCRLGYHAGAIVVNSEVILAFNGTGDGLLDEAVATLIAHRAHWMSPSGIEDIKRISSNPYIAPILKLGS